MDRKEARWGNMDWMYLVRNGNRGNEPSGSTEGWELLDYLSDC
jgi:hypothetical protein